MDKKNEESSDKILDMSNLQNVNIKNDDDYIYKINMNKNIIVDSECNLFTCNNNKIIFHKNTNILLLIILHVKIKEDNQDVLFLKYNDDKYFMANLEKDLKIIPYQNCLNITSNDNISFSNLDSLKIKHANIIIIDLNKSSTVNNNITKNKLWLDIKSQYIFKNMDNILYFDNIVNNISLYNIYNNFMVINTQEEKDFILNFQFYISIKNMTNGIFELQVLNNNIIIKKIVCDILKLLNISLKITVNNPNVLKFNIIIDSKNNDDDGIIILPESHLYIKNL